MSLTRGDTLVIAGAVALALILWAGFYAFPRTAAELAAVVRVDGKEVARLPVTGGTISQKVVDIPRGVATISYGEGRVRVEPLDDHTCPNGICWKTGWVSRAGQSIVCVPNRMTVTLEGSTSEVDSVVR
ncbi:MAG: NusG domain II-containing protein [Bacillota bacterium]